MYNFSNFFFFTRSLVCFSYFNILTPTLHLFSNLRFNYISQHARIIFLLYHSILNFRLKSHHMYSCILSLISSFFTRSIQFFYFNSTFDSNSISPQNYPKFHPSPTLRIFSSNSRFAIQTLRDTDNRG